MLDDNLLEFTEGRPLPLVAADQRYFMAALANDTVRPWDYVVVLGVAMV